MSFAFGQNHLGQRRVEAKKDNPLLQRLYALPSPAIYAPGDVICRQDSPLTHVVVIREGCVKLVCTRDKSKPMIIGLRGDGWLIGASAAIVGAPYDLQAICVTPCVVSKYPVELFLSELEGDRELRTLTNYVTAQEARARLESLLELRSMPAQDRVERMLDEIEEFAQTASRGPVRLPQIDLAQLLSITPEHLCRVLGKVRSGVTRIPRNGAIHCLSLGSPVNRERLTSGAGR